MLRKRLRIPSKKNSSNYIHIILYRTRLRLSLQATAQKMQEALESIRELIKQHAVIDEVTSRVRFLEFGESAQEFELCVYIKTRDFDEDLEQLKTSI